MTPEHRKRAWAWAKSGAMLLVFGAMFFALDHLLRAYSLDEIENALAKLSPALVAGAIGVLALQQGFQVVREWLGVGYAGRPELAMTHIALASVVTRSLSTLGFSSVTGVGLRLHIYEGWGFTPTDVAKISVYDNAVFLVGIAAQFGLAFTLLPVPAQLAASLGVVPVRLIGGLCVAIILAYALWSRRGHDLHIRSFVISVPTFRQLLGQIFLPIIDLALTTLIVNLCLPGGLGLSYLDLLVICPIASIAGSISQVPAGLGVLEGTVLLFANRPEAAPAIVAGLFVYRLVTNLFPIVIGAVLLVILEVRRHVPTAASAAPESDAATALRRMDITATVLAALTFAVGAVVLLASFTRPFGEVRQVVGVAAGAGVLFVARGLQNRNRWAWRAALGLLLVRTVVGIAVQPLISVLVALVLVGTLLGFSRRVFTEVHHEVPPSPRWWIAATMVLASTLWVGFVSNGRHVTASVYATTVAMSVVAAIAVIAAIVSRRLSARAQPPDA